MKVYLIAAISADGYIGSREDETSISWTSDADKKFFISKTKEIGTVVMGRTTFDTFNKPLKDRRLIILTHNPESINVESVEASSESPEALIDRLKNENLEAVAICGGTHIYTEFLQAGLIDELYLTVMAKLFGKGLPLTNGHIDKDLQLIDISKLDELGTVLLHYKTT